MSSMQQAPQERIKSNKKVKSNRKGKKRKQIKGSFQIHSTLNDISQKVSVLSYFLQVFDQNVWPYYLFFFFLFSSLPFFPSCFTLYFLNMCCKNTTMFLTEKSILQNRKERRITAHQARIKHLYEVPNRQGQLL